jgi:hypothetical protein
MSWRRCALVSEAVISDGFDIFHLEMSDDTHIYIFTKAQTLELLRGKTTD